MSHSLSHACICVIRLRVSGNMPSPHRYFPGLLSGWESLELAGGKMTDATYLLVQPKTVNIDF